ncbi:MAG: hypothetical protein RIC84_22815, partial [Aggregatilineales bacterium]
KIPDNVRVAVAKAIEVSRLHNTTLSRVALQFALNNDAIATTLIGMQKEEEVIQNIDLINNAIAQEIVSLVQKSLKSVKDYALSVGLPENHDI